jgi:hypothetical protein
MAKGFPFGKKAAAPKGGKPNPFAKKAGPPMAPPDAGGMPFKKGGKVKR